MSASSKRTRREHEHEDTIQSETSDWDHEKTLQFIELYESYPNLWDRGHAEYRKGGPRNVALDAMSNELGVSVKELQRKIHRLQTAFNAQWKRIKLAAENGETVQTNWPYFNAMRFLEKSYKILEEQRAEKETVSPTKRSRRKKRKSIRHPDEYDSTRRSRHNMRKDDENVITKHETEYLISDDEDSYSDDCYIGVSSKAVQPADGFDQATTAQNQMKVEDERMHPTSTTVNVAHTPHTSHVTHVSHNASAVMQTPMPQCNDRIDAFFKAMADTVKTFPNKNIAEVKLRISQIIGEMELTLASEEEVLVSSF